MAEVFAALAAVKSRPQGIISLWMDRQTHKFEFWKQIPTTNHKHQVSTTWATSECKQGFLAKPLGVRFA
ncbi:hypothetical protein [Kamptonema sp. UHCC 0994]|uniref:hypothetical protein n=1 Tax=Kamptonema sp. UHCC 0994 TaxID=3031329 RepID=UPI0023B712F0|nr:hypothetical protein [Kamptonema sp. UHCC 0994]MDF0551880.1 hypothetical protein [Kamptonema sp. UHCC 0994]